MSAAGTEVTATGTAFLVRVDRSNDDVPEVLDVTLVEGQVIVQDKSKVVPRPMVLSAGDRVRIHNVDENRLPLRKAAEPRVDRPRMDQVLAWRRGEVIFDDVPLQMALAELNRYIPVPMVAKPSVAELRVSGLYKAGDREGFARAIAMLHGLTVTQYEDRLEFGPK